MTEVFSAARTRQPGALLAVLFLHLLLGVLLLRSVVVRDKPAALPRLGIIFLTPRPVIPQTPAAPLVTERAAKPSRPAHVKPDNPRQAPAIVPPAEPIPAEPVQEKTETQAIDTAALIAMAGKFDKEVRKPGENLLSGAEGKSLRAKMDEAFKAAHLAVPLKWYEAARVELWSAENDPAKIYQVKTAFGTYCLFYADRLKNPDAPSQPRMASCPKRF